jgi:hypothetical protein
MSIISRFPWLYRQGVVLILLFGYLLLTVVTVEQARTIDAQRNLIQALSRDSLELSALRLQQHLRRR